ncbi:DinB family protein [Microbulbifer harenosus]|uniref:Damage-inducible protein DinB n=1 Tax=Microbulbifer harenosus TaxID=2576840 RepID=A0ABY2UL15_9GAMM|nr:DinB family protein [Microbulbifer harenosus]TLM77069.1 damage-inducible protein DinB [Microbulbifer harenosus]
MESKFRYKAWANQELLELIRQINREEHPEQWTMAVRLLNHTHVVDKIFIAHLKGEDHPYTATNTPETPTLAELNAKIQSTDQWLINYAVEFDRLQDNRVISFTFTDCDRGSMSVSEILDHLIIHGTYHRGNIGMLLTACGIPRPGDTFTRFLHS